MFLFLLSPLLHQVFAAPGGLPNFSNGLGDGPYELFGLDLGWTSWLQLQYFKVPASSDSSYDPSVLETSTPIASPSVAGTYTSTPLSWTSPANSPSAPAMSSQIGSPSITWTYTSTTPSWTFPSNDSTVSDTSSQVDSPSMSGTCTSTILSWISSPTSPSSAPPSTSTATADPPVVPGGLNTSAVVDQHNLHRQNSTGAVSPLSWSADLANTAADIAASCVYGHNTTAAGGGYGQNIAAGSPPGPNGVPAVITNGWYNAEVGWYPLPYGNDNPDMSLFEHWGHYSQMVWQSTDSVGCAIQYCAEGLGNTNVGISPWFLVCNYGPAGNFGGQYANVPQPGNDSTVILPT